MAMGRRKRNQSRLWISPEQLPKSPGHPFYERLNRLLDGAGFDDFVERECRRFYAKILGRPSLAPGRYFRLLLVGYFEGLGSERGIAWRASDSLAVRSFVGLDLEESAPDHSTISRTRRLIDVETHGLILRWVQERLAEAGLFKGKTIAIDATTLEANAAMRSIVRRDTGETYDAYLEGLAKASGIKTPTREALARFDRRRKRKASNDDWTSPSDPDAKITKMKDGRTHLAHKAEHAVDLDSGAIVAVTVQGADEGDTETISETLMQAIDQVESIGAASGGGKLVHEEGVQAVVADKGYHSDAVLCAIESQAVRSYISEPDRGRRKWEDEVEAQAAVYANRRRTRRSRGQRLHRRRGELVERSFAHMYRTGGMRRMHVRGHENVRKRVFLQAAGFNLGILMRNMVGVGTPREFAASLLTSLVSFLNETRVGVRAATAFLTADTLPLLRAA